MTSQKWRYSITWKDNSPWIVRTDSGLQFVKAVSNRIWKRYLENQNDRLL